MSIKEFVKETIHRQNLLIDNLRGSRSETRDGVNRRGERRKTTIASEPIQMNRNARREHRERRPRKTIVAS